MTAEVTAVVPTHNRRGLLATTLRSVLWQRDVDLEVVVVDDGSSDGTGEHVTGLGEPRVRLVRHERPLGVSAARNRGIAEATGEWIAFCDDDDLWAPEKLARQLAAARMTGRGWAYAGAVKVDLGLRVVGGSPPPPPQRVMARLPRWNLVPGGCSGVVARAPVLDATGGFDHRLVNLADWDLWIRLGQTGPPACVPRPLVGYRFHAGNASRDTRLILDELDLVDGRYGVLVDRGAVHHYLAWVELRSSRSRAALGHFARAGLAGHARSVVADLLPMVRRRLGLRTPAGPAQPGDRAWRDEAVEWLGQLAPP